MISDYVSDILGSDKPELLIYNPETRNHFVEQWLNEHTNADEKKYTCIAHIHRNEFDFGIQFDKIIHEADFSDADREYFNGKEILVIKELDEMLPGAKSVDFGALHGTIYFYKLAAQEKNEQRFFYKEFSNRGGKYKEVNGIKIYRDNFLVRPYGIPDSTGFDWLDLSTRKAASPAGPAHETGSWKVQANQMCGHIYITIQQKPSRQIQQRRYFGNK